MRANTVVSLSSSPFVSVIIPVRNAREYIHEAIDSVLQQSGVSFEILIMDDGSDDYDYQQLQEYDRRIHVTRLDGKGVSHARNEGMKIARGDYFAFIDADDLWFPGKLIAQLCYFESHPEVGVVFGGFTRWERDDRGVFTPPSLLIRDCSSLRERDPERSGWLYTKLLMGLLVGMNTAVIRRQLYLQIGGFDESMRIGEDYDYWLRASRVTQMHALVGSVALYRIHESGAMHQLDRENHLALLLKKAHRLWGGVNLDGTELSIDDFNSRLATVEFDHGYNHYWNGDARIARRSFTQALRCGYKPFRSFTYLFLSWIKLIFSHSSNLSDA